MSFRSSSLLVLGMSLAGVVIACAPDDGVRDQDGGNSGGTTSTTGGATSATGGETSTGGTTTSGGAPATGGATTSGGSVGTGGDVGTGGSSTSSCTPNPSGALVDQGNGVVHDERTCLDWQKATTVNSAGVTAIEGLAKCPAESTGGFNDWRAPTASELASIVTQCNGGNWTEGQVFDQLFDDPGDGYWSATPDAAGTEHQCLIVSNTGAMNSRRMDDTIRIRCVRGEGTVPTVKDCNDGTPNCSNWTQ